MNSWVMNYGYAINHDIYKFIPVIQSKFEYYTKFIISIF